MITARTTRLVRAPNLHAFRQAAADLACGGTPFDIRDRLVLVPTRAAAAYLTRSIERRLADAGAFVLPDFVTRHELHARLAQRLPQPPAVLTSAEREVLMAVACDVAARAGAEPPFHLRPGLVAAILEFYDTLRQNARQVDTFERLALGMLEPGAADDRGAERLLRQTRFLVAAYRAFERLREESGAADEHVLRDRLLDEPASRPWRHVVVAVGDRAFDPFGLCVADWDLLARLPGLERLDVLVTDEVLAGAFHERMHHLLPGIAETRVDARDATAGPVLLVPPGGALVHAARDREEEVAGFARWVRAGRPVLDRVALVVRRPLPYVYLTRQVLRSAAISSQMFDALPLAAEPFAAALDLVWACVSANFARGPAIALLRSPHFTFDAGGAAPAPRGIADLDRALGEAGYLGGLEALERLVAGWSGADSGSPSTAARTAAAVLLATSRELAPLGTAAPCADHLDRLLAFLGAHARLPASDDPIRVRLLRGRAAVLDVLAALRDAYGRFDLRPVEVQVVAAVVRRWIEARTFAPFTGEGGVHLIDADSARFGDFDRVQVAGLVEGEWPERPRRNIFFPASLLRELGWPAESDRLHYERAAFRDLLRLPSSQLVVSTFTLEDDALVAPSPLADVVAESGLSVEAYQAPVSRVFDYEALAFDPVELRYVSETARTAAVRRIEASGRSSDRKGRTTARPLAAYAVGAIERYQDCPFKFFAADILRLEEPPADQSVLSPRAHGTFVHEVFQRFFEAWDARGDGTMTVDRFDEARALFEDVAAPLLERLPAPDAALERARLFGSAASLGIADVVLGMEASRPARVEERWLEYRLEGDFSLGTPDGRRVPLKGVADRVDLLEGHRLRVIDYKSGSAPNPRRALQAAIYALCAQERLEDRGRGAWAVDEASYVAFAGKRTVVPVVRAGGADAAAVLSSARERLLEAVDGIARGEFPPRPHEVRICTYCAYPSVCRKDYVGDD
ncbi:MAG: PD-(D/E)XK nuclease family protein [Acidobacteria bacterium]|nr:PD-(D/E)XK nuclease family protein [Acidobacteriota bacterium]